MSHIKSTKPQLNASLLIGAFYFFYFALVGVYIIFLPKLLLSDGFSATEVGIIYSAAPFMRFIIPFIFVNYIDLTDKVYKFSLLFTLLSTLLFFFTINSFYGYLIANLIFGASMGIALPFVETIALQIVSKERYGRVRLWGSLGFMAISLWLGHILTETTEGLSYLSIAALATLLTGYFVSRFEKKEEHHLTQKERNRDFSLLKYWAFWVSAFLLQVSFGGFYNFFTIYETAHGISLETTSYLWSFGVICEIVLFYFQGPLLKRNLLSLLEFSIAATILRWVLIYIYPSSLLVAYLSQSLHAFSFALYYTAVIAYVYSIYTQKKLAQQFLLGLTFGLGGSVGALIAGWIYDINSEMLFGFESIIALISLLALKIHKKRRATIICK